MKALKNEEVLVANTYVGDLNKISQISSSNISQNRLGVSDKYENDSFTDRDYIDYDLLRVLLEKEKKQLLTKSNAKWSGYRPGKHLNNQGIILGIIAGAKYSPEFLKNSKHDIAAFIRHANGLPAGFLSENAPPMSLLRSLPGRCFNSFSHTQQKIELEPLEQRTSSSATNSRRFNIEMIEKETLISNHSKNSLEASQFVMKKFGTNSLHDNRTAIVDIDATINPFINTDVAHWLKYAKCGVFRFKTFLNSPDSPKFPTIDITKCLSSACRFIEVHITKRFPITWSMFRSPHYIDTVNNTPNALEARDVLDSLKIYLAKFFDTFDVDLELHELPAIAFGNQYHVMAVVKNFDSTKSRQRCLLSVYLPRALSNYYRSDAEDLYALFKFLVATAKTVHVCDPNPIVCSLVAAVLAQFCSIEREFVSFRDTFNIFEPDNLDLFPDYANAGLFKNSKMTYYRDWLVHYNVHEKAEGSPESDEVGLFDSMIPQASLETVDFKKFGLFEQTVCSQKFNEIMELGKHIVSLKGGYKGKHSPLGIDVKTLPIDFMQAMISTRTQLVMCYNASFTSCFQSLSKANIRKISLTLLFDEKVCKMLPDMLSQLKSVEEIELFAPNYRHPDQPFDLEHRITHQFLTYLIGTFKVVRLGNVSFIDTCKYPGVALSDIVCTKLIIDYPLSLPPDIIRFLNYHGTKICINCSRVDTGGVDPCFWYKIFVQEHSMYAPNLTSFVSGLLTPIKAREETNKTAKSSSIEFNELMNCTIDFLSDDKNDYDLNIQKNEMKNKNITSGKDPSADYKLKILNYRHDEPSASEPDYNKKENIQVKPRCFTLCTLDNDIFIYQNNIFKFANFIPYDKQHWWCLGWKTTHSDRTLYGDELFQSQNEAYELVPFNKLDIFDQKVMKIRMKQISAKESLKAMLSKLGVILKSHVLQYVNAIRKNKRDPQAQEEINTLLQLATLQFPVKKDLNPRSEIWEALFPNTKILKPALACGLEDPYFMDFLPLLLESDIVAVILSKFDKTLVEEKDVLSYAKNYMALFFAHTMEEVSRMEIEFELNCKKKEAEIPKDLHEQVFNEFKISMEKFEEMAPSRESVFCDIHGFLESTH